jgi:hypothetical protein
VSFVGAGTCTIDANQAGTSEIGPAPLAQQSFGVGAAPAAHAPGSVFLALGAKVDAKTGSITFSESVWGGGTFSWLLTFQNGKFGAFAASARCKAGLIKLKRKCRPARIVYASGSQPVAAKGLVSFTIVPTASARKALRYALRHKRGLPVRVTLTYQASPAGIPSSQVQSITVRPKR